MAGTNALTASMTGTVPATEPATHPSAAYHHTPLRELPVLTLPLPLVHVIFFLIKEMDIMIIIDVVKEFHRVEK